MAFENGFELGILFFVEQQGTWGIEISNINKSRPAPQWLLANMWQAKIFRI